MRNWPLSNWQRWKHKEAARELGLRLVHSRPPEFVNPYPCAVGLVPPVQRSSHGCPMCNAPCDCVPGDRAYKGICEHCAPRAMIGTRIELRQLSPAERAAEFVRRHAKRSLGDDAA